MNSQRKIILPRQSYINLNKDKSKRSLTGNKEREGTQNIANDIKELKEGQAKILSALTILTILPSMKESIDNLAKVIGELANKINGNGNNSKKDSSNQSLCSENSRKSSDTAFYRRRDLDKKQDNSTKRIDEPKTKEIQVINNYNNYSKFKKKK